MWQWCSNRSISAAAITPSPSTCAHSSKLLFEVSTVDALLVAGLDQLEEQHPPPGSGSHSPAVRGAELVQALDLLALDARLEGEVELRQGLDRRQPFRSASMRAVARGGHRRSASSGPPRHRRSGGVAPPPRARARASLVSCRHLVWPRAVDKASPTTVAECARTTASQ